MVILVLFCSTFTMRPGWIWTSCQGRHFGVLIWALLGTLVSRLRITQLHILTVLIMFHNYMFETIAAKNIFLVKSSWQNIIEITNRILLYSFELLKVIISSKCLSAFDRNWVILKENLHLIIYIDFFFIISCDGQVVRRW